MKIPESQRQQLASSAVGTPGVDRSGEMLGESISNAGQQAWGAFNKLSKERQRVQDEVVAAKGLMDLQRKTEATTLQHDEDYADFTGPMEDRVKAYEEKAKVNYDEILGSMPAGAARDKFSVEGADFMNRSIVSQMRTADRNRALIAHKTTVSELDLTAHDIADLGDNVNVDFETKKSLIEQKMVISDQLLKGGHLTTEDKINLGKAKPEMMAKAYAATAILRNPAEVVQMVDSGAFGKELDPTVANKIKDEALAALPAFKEKAELMTALGDGKTFSGVLQKIAQGDSAGAAVELANLPNTKAVQVFRAQLYKTKVNEPSDPYQEARLMDRFQQLEYDSKSKTAKANAVDLIEYMTDLSKTRTEGGIDQKSFNSKLAQMVTPFLAKIGDDKPALLNSHATGWQAIKQWFGGYGDLKSKTPEAVDVYNDFATVLSQQPKITSETVTSSLRQALGNYARKSNPEFSFMAELPDVAMRPNGVTNKVGTGSNKKADASVKDESVLLTREGVTKLFPKSQEKTLIANQWKRANGNS